MDLLGVYIPLYNIFKIHTSTYVMELRLDSIRSLEIILRSSMNRDKHVFSIKNLQKTADAINMILCKCYQNPLGQLLKQFSKLYKLWGPVT